MLCCFDTALQSKLHTVTKSMVKRNGSTKLKQYFSVFFSLFFFLKMYRVQSGLSRCCKLPCRVQFRLHWKEKQQNFHWLHWGQDLLERCHVSILQKLTHLPLNLCLLFAYLVRQTYKVQIFLRDSESATAAKIGNLLFDVILYFWN